MSVHDLRSMTWPAFQSLERDTVVAILPLGAMEAHGPHLPLGTDIVIAEEMARAGAARLSARGLSVVVLPAIPVAPAPFAAAFAGTLNTPAHATSDLIRGIAHSLARAGVRMMAIANAHHDPAHVGAIRAAAADPGTDSTATIVFPDLTRRRWAARLSEEFQSGACHAGRYEGSIVLAAAPELVDTSRLAVLPDNPRSLVDAIRRGHTTFAEAGGPDAYFGWPAAATAAEGHETIEQLGAVIEEAVLEALMKNEELRTKNEELEPGTGNVEPERRAKNEERRREPPGLVLVNPAALGTPRGFSHGMLTPAGRRTLYVAGQTAAGQAGDVTEEGFAGQFAAALTRVVAVVREAGGGASDIARMTIYVTDLDAYRASRPQLGAIWAAQMGEHYPAMALVEVKGLVDRGALVEIEADAAVPAWPGGDAAMESR